MKKEAKISNKSTTERQLDIDVLKGLGIIMVVLGHLKPYEILRTHIYSCHMFIFFFASGLLFKADENIFKHIWKRIKRLLFPFLVWNYIGQFAEFFYDGTSIEELFSQMFMLDGMIGWNAPVWFLLASFWIDLLYVLIHRFLTKKSVLAVSIAAFWFAFSLAKFEIIYPLGLQYVPVGMAFFCLGAWCRKAEIKEKLENGIFKNYFAYVLMLALLLTLNYVFGVKYNDMISVFKIKYSNYMLTIIAGIAGVFFYWFITIKMKDSWFLANLGRNTLIILCTHYFLLRNLAYTSLNTIGLDLWNFQSSVKAILITAIMLMLYTIVTPLLGLIRKYIPVIRWLV